MYKIRTAGYSKSNLQMRWALPERIFFACGACHILAYAFLEQYGSPDMKALWLRPEPGFTGNHIFISTDTWVFDYHGYSERKQFFSHTFKRARHLWPGWQATVIELPPDVLVSEARSRTYDGLWLREPKQFLHDAMPRARAYLGRFSPPPLYDSGAARSDVLDLRPPLGGVGRKSNTGGNVMPAAGGP
jgi:hypothetical protein